MPQIFVKQRATETGDIVFDTPAIDVGGMPLIIFELIVYTLTIGGGQMIQAQLQTSNDLETWSDVSGISADLSAVGSDPAAALASSAMYGRYVRFRIATTNGVTDVSYSLILNTYASS